MSIDSVVFLGCTGTFHQGEEKEPPNLTGSYLLARTGICTDFLFWFCHRGVWALIQAQISQIDFDYADYAEQRLGEYWAWKREVDGSRAKAGEEVPLREKRWAQEA